MPDLPRLLWSRAELIGMRRCIECGWSQKEMGHHETCPNREDS